MKKFLIFILLFFSAVVISGFYGVVHDQVSYTVSPEYYTRFKFFQFGLDQMNLPDRVRVAMVGFAATWWMGIPIGIMVGGLGFMHIGEWRMLKNSLLAYGVVLVAAMICGLAGLLDGYLQTGQIDLAQYRDWYIPDGVVHLRRFLCVGYMHNASYLGGGIGILLAGFFQVILKIKQTRDERAQK